MAGDPDPSSLHTVKLTLPASLQDTEAGAVASVLEEEALSTSALRADNDHRAAWTVTWLFDHKPDAAALAARLNVDATLLAVESVPQVNWLEHSYRQFKPFSVGGFFIYGSHHEGETPDNLMPLQIDASTAFGSGEHGTTAGCILALESLYDDNFTPRNILDMGTGSGILAVAACKLWNLPVLAVDIEEESVALTNVHAKLNNAKSFIAVVHGDGFATPQVQQQKPFDLIIANILAGPLVAMAPDLIACLDKGGYVLLSGMLEEQAIEVITRYESLGLTLHDRVDRSGWTSLLLKSA